MSTYKRGNVWWYSITIDGVTERKSCYTTDERQARELHDRRRAELWRVAVAGDKPRRTWVETVRRWLVEHKHKKSYRDDERYAQFWNDKFAGLGAVFMDEITPDLIKEIRDAEAGRVSERRGTVIAPATVNRHLCFLRTVVNAAYREYRWLDGSPPLFKLLPEHGERVRFLTPSELHRLFAVLPEPYASVAKFAVSTGLRQGNCIGLRWGEVDFSSRVVKKPGMVMKNGQPLTVPLNNMAVDAIRPWVGRHEEFVFVRADGQPINGVPTKMWVTALKRVGITDFRFHDLRHTWASIMRQGGVGLDVLQELGGWKQSRMVQRYAHLSVSHLMGHANRFDQLVGSGTVQILHSPQSEKGLGIA